MIGDLVGRCAECVVEGVGDCIPHQVCIMIAKARGDGCEISGIACGGCILMDFEELVVCLVDLSRCCEYGCLVVGFAKQHVFVVELA